jgi:hypothetical protein
MVMPKSKRKRFSKKNPAYEYLKTIKKPVLLIVQVGGEDDRIRLLDPAGNCYWDAMRAIDKTGLVESCFIKWNGGVENLAETVERMKEFDNRYCDYQLVISEVIEL